MADRCTKIMGQALVLGIGCAWPAQAAGAGSHVDPAQIDRAVEAFTGVAIGNPGGARSPADRRLRLSSCPEPLSTAWHGSPGRTVRVACESGGGWQLFVALRPVPQSAQAFPVVKRGDRVTVAVRGRGFTIQQPGEATEAGRAGEWIAIRVANGQKTVSARIERAGLAVIDDR